jgi:predicted ribosome quality control (RQC) complex YloA/Tae2 family protein
LDGWTRQLEHDAEAEVLRRKGELLFSYLAAIPPRAEKILLPPLDLIEDLRESAEVQTEVQVEIQLDPELSPVRNAERYFKKYKKARVDQNKAQKIQEEIASLGRGIEELREQRDLLESIEDLAQLEEAVRDVAEWIGEASGTRRGLLGQNAKPARSAKKASKALPLHLRFDLDGCGIFLGLSARGNRFVTFKLAVGSDLWFHAHDVPGAHVILRIVDPRVVDPRVTEPRVTDPQGGNSATQGSAAQPARAILFAASLAAAYSRGKTSLSVQVDYTERRHVRSVPGTMALVTYTEPRTIRVDPNYWKEVL